MKLKTILEKNGIQQKTIADALGMKKTQFNFIVNEKKGYYPIRTRLANRIVTIVNKIIQRRRYITYGIEDLFSKKDIR